MQGDVFNRLRDALSDAVTQQAVTLCGRQRKWQIDCIAS
jgi:hypothetical protein